MGSLTCDGISHVRHSVFVFPPVSTDFPGCIAIVPSMSPFLGKYNSHGCLIDFKNRQSCASPSVKLLFNHYKSSSMNTMHTNSTPVPDLYTLQQSTARNKALSLRAILLTLGATLRAFRKPSL